MSAHIFIVQESESLLWFVWSEYLMLGSECQVWLRCDGCGPKQSPAPRRGRVGVQHWHQRHSFLPMVWKIASPKISLTILIFFFSVCPETSRSNNKNWKLILSVIRFIAKILFSLTIKMVISGILTIQANVLLDHCGGRWTALKFDYIPSKTLNVLSCSGKV